ncbi:MAG TPA: type IV pilus twitching motility protein PilT [Anaerovoracaceae bacterium]|nr:type IV pilus twitching motility protein PilT [Anaerovoracaceae bacterium]
MNFLELAEEAIKQNASDLHITVGVPPILRINGVMHQMDLPDLRPEDTAEIIKQVLNERQLNTLNEKGEIDTSFSSPGLSRFRINTFKQRGSYGMALRAVALRIPGMEELGIPPILKELARKPRGLILVTGPTGSGKSTTLATMIEQINRERNCHILTLEDPIEYLHKHNKSIVNQREIGHDSLTFSNALRASLRQDPDVILVGEMRDLETISIALTAAETGHLVLSTLHTLGAAKTIDRVIDIFPPHQQQQIRVQLASVIEGIIFQQLLIRADNSGRVAAFEVMTATPAIRNMIREGKSHQIQTNIQTGMKFGMQSMDSSLLELYKRGAISQGTALAQAMDIDFVRKYL